ncbi:MAG: hypothetical protein ABI366_06745 [Ginsengibacter sp.]
MKLFVPLFLLTTLICCKPGFSQKLEKENVANLQVKNAIDLYNHYNADYAPVYNGESYLYYTMKMEGSPFFKSGDFSRGWVNYKGRKYDSLQLLYDITRNQLVTLYPDKVFSIIIQNQFVDSFFLQGHTFIALEEDHKQNLYNSGFYDLLYNGKTQLLARRAETLLTVIQVDVLVTKFINHTHYYIHKNGLYYLVSNKKDVYHVFEDNIRDLKRRMRRNHIKLRRKNFETALIKVTAFYDQLSH